MSERNMQQVIEGWRAPVGWGGDGHDSSDCQTGWVREIREQCADEASAIRERLVGLRDMMAAHASIKRKGSKLGEYVRLLDEIIAPEPSGGRK